MRVLRLVIGIASVIAFFIIFLKSCGQAPDPDTAQQVSGIGGFIMAALIFAAGAIGGTTRKNKITSIIAGIIYLVAAVVGFLKIGMVADMTVWAIASVVAGVFFLVSGIFMKDLVYGEKPKFK
ncbi:MAG: hypothetical protein GX254_03695 [Clostridiales bacterium]|jgi:hypothetical protein|nr:hypothetical protein [Clostridiales bacterium]